MKTNYPHMDATTIEAATAALVALLTTVYGIYQKVMSVIANNKTAAAEQDKASATAAKDKAEAEAAVKAAEYQALDDLMNPYVEQTEEQTALIEAGAVSDAAWKMSIDTVEELSKRLTAAGGLASINVVKAVVNQAEKDKQVEYAILCTPAEGTGKTIDEYPAAFISYGTIAKIDKWGVIKEIARAHQCGDWYSIAG